MTNWQAISKSQHQHATWHPVRDYRHTAGDTLAPLLVSEMPSALPYYPLAFQQQEGHYQLVALLSLHPGLNLYVDDQGRWLAPYIPACYRAYPFALARDAQSDQLTLCVDTDAHNFFADEDPGAANPHQPLFTAQGDTTPELNNLLQFLQSCQQQRQGSTQLIAQLEQHQLIQPWNLSLQQDTQTPDSPTSTAVEGLYSINEERLQHLPGAVYENLAATGALGLAYAQLFSQNRLQDFKRRYQYHQQQQAQNVASEVDLDTLFGDAEDDLFKF